MAKGQARRARSLLGELPRFVRDALGDEHDERDDHDEPSPDGDELTEDAEAVVRELVDLGLDEEDARQAVRADRVPLALIQGLRGERPRYTLAEVSRRSGVAEGFLRQVRTASGLALKERYTRDDLAYARRLHRLMEVISPEAVLRAARARGTVLSTVARNDLGTLHDELVLPLRQQGADDLTVARAMADAVHHLDDVGREILLYTYNQHLEQMVGSELSAVMARTADPELEIAVGFVDVVGWTQLSSEADPGGLDAVLDTFERRVMSVVTRAADVSVVKYVGDAVMLVAPEPVALAEVMLELTRPDEDLEDAPLRGGLASGPVRLREGDYYGDAVNLAARLTDLARPWSVLADEGVEEALAQRFELRRLSAVNIRGLGSRRPLRLRGGTREAVDV